MKFISRGPSSIFGMTLTALVLVIFGLWLAVSLSRHKLTKYRQSLQDRGEHFDIGALTPPLPSEQGNGAPELIMACKALRSQVNGSKVPRLSFRWDSGTGSFPLDQARATPRLMGGAKLSWQEFRDQTDFLKPSLKKIREASAATVLEFHPEYGSDPSEEASQAAYVAAEHLGSAALLGLHDGDVPTAAASIRAMLALAGMIQKQPLLISQIYATSILSKAQMATWELLQVQPANSTSLRDLQSAWESITVAKFLLPTLRLERARALPYFSAPGSTYPFFPPAAFPRSPPMSETLSVILSIWGIFFRYEDENQLIADSQDLIDLANKANLSETWIPVIEKSQEIENVQKKNGALLFMSRSAATQIRSLTHRLIGTQALTNLTIAALALKRYQLDHGTYPASIGALVPEYLAGLPTDPYDGKPLRYQCLDPENFVLYSIGEDGRDGGGDAAFRTGQRELTGRKDIVWPKAIDQKPEAAQKQKLTPAP